MFMFFVCQEKLTIQIVLSWKQCDNDIYTDSIYGQKFVFWRDCQKFHFLKAFPTVGIKLKWIHRLTNLERDAYRRVLHLSSFWILAGSVYLIFLTAGQSLTGIMDMFLNVGHKFGTYDRSGLCERRSPCTFLFKIYSLDLIYRESREIIMWASAWRRLRYQNLNFSNTLLKKVLKFENK